MTSPYPVILSIENRCSLQQQVKMAQIFISVLGEKLVKSYLFESDFEENPLLPSPNQLKYKILIKNKKLQRQAVSVPIQQQTQQQLQTQFSIPSNPQQQSQAQVTQTPKKQLSQTSKTSMIQQGNIVNGSGQNQLDWSKEKEDINNEQNEVNNKGVGNGLVNRIKTISTLLTAVATEPKIKQNVVNFIHKSKSLTDAAFNKISNGKGGIISNKTELLTNCQINEVSNLIDADIDKTAPNHFPASPASLSVSPSVAGIAAQGSGSGPGSTSTAPTQDELSYLNRIRRRASIRNNSSLECGRSENEKKRESSLEMIARIKNSISTELNEYFKHLSYFSYIKKKFI